jgi:acyl carrier protein
MDTRSFVYSIISSKTGMKNISDTQKLRDDLGLDSLDQLQLIMQIEDEYRLPEITSEKMSVIQTVGDLINVIEATDTKPMIIKNNTPSLKLYTIKANVPYCKITEKKCDKLHSTMGIRNFSDCSPERCKIAKNVLKIMSETQKTK